MLSRMQVDRRPRCERCARLFCRCGIEEIAMASHGMQKQSNTRTFEPRSAVRLKIVPFGVFVPRKSVAGYRKSVEKKPNPSQESPDEPRFIQLCSKSTQL